MQKCSTMWGRAPAIALLACTFMVVLSSQVVQAQQSQQACKNVRPDAPKDLTLKAMPSTSSIGAVWKPPGNGACVDYFLVYVRPVTGSSREPKAHQVKSKSIIISNLKPNTPYQVDIVAVSKQGRSPNARQSLTTLNGPSCNPNQLPGPGRNIKAFAVGGRTDKVTINWLAPNNPATACLTGYRLEGYDATSGVRVVVTTVASEIREISVNGLLTGTKYNFKIVSLASTADGKSVTATVTTNARVQPAVPVSAPVPTPPPTQPAPAPKPPVPTPAAVPKPQPTTPAATPQPATAPAPQPTAPAPQPAAYTPAPAPSVSAGQSSGPCQGSQKPAAPQTLKATPQGSNKITLSWASGDSGICVDTYHIDGYQLRSGDRVADIDTPNTSYTLGGLQPGIEYVFTISGKNKAGESVPGTAMTTIPKPNN